MSRAQAAWAVLTGLLLIAAVVLFAVPTVSSITSNIAGSVCLAFGILGWALLGGMIASDVKAKGGE